MGASTELSSAEGEHTQEHNPGLQERARGKNCLAAPSSAPPRSQIKAMVFWGIKLEDLKLFTPQHWPSPSHHHVLPRGVGHFPPNPRQPRGDPRVPLLHRGTKNSWELS